MAKRLVGAYYSSILPASPGAGLVEGSVAGTPTCRQESRRNSSSFHELRSPPSMKISCGPAFCDARQVVVFSRANSIFTGGKKACATTQSGCQRGCGNARVSKPTNSRSAGMATL